MPEAKVSEFSKDIGALCVKRDTNVQKSGAVSASIGLLKME
jgi:hypothetical protein